ncbi:MAG: CBS domain-containing protein [Proteobacteria bacterium]|nr:CBS domain-containing protein [Pseudomonadota bacterium]
MQLVKQVLDTKGGAIHAIEPEQPVLEAIRAMADKRIGALLVMRGTQLLGIVSERDYARKVILQGRSSAATPVREIMSASVLTVAPGDSVGQCMKLMTGQRVRHLPVVDNGRVVGVVSIGDLVKAVIEDQAQELEHMQRYISG